MWKNGDRVEVTLPMALRQEPVAGSPELATLSYGPLTLAAEMGRDGLTPEMIIGPEGPKMDELPPLGLPKFAAAGGTAGLDKWLKKASDGELRFQTFGQVRDYAFKPIAHVNDERYSVYWQKTGAV
jgi:hypothetical protein